MLCAACQRREQGLKKMIPGNRLSFLLHRPSRSSSSSASSPPVETALLFFSLKEIKVCVCSEGETCLPDPQPTTPGTPHSKKHNTKNNKKKKQRKNNTIHLSSRGSGAETRLTTAAGASANCCTLLNRAASLRNIVTLFALPQHQKKKEKERARGGGGAG